MRPIASLFLAASLVLSSGCDSQAEEASRKTVTVSSIETIQLSESEWRKKLSSSQYRILREAGTERAFTSALLKEKRAGTFVCAGCDLPLFSSETKFESGTGWPSFWQPIERDHVLDKSDTAYGMVRTENVCARCDGHLGHVFRDGPRPTGLRFCINGESLKFVPAQKE
jgi:peptide-methionine (R)-S-oxide reductase